MATSNSNDFDVNGMRSFALHAADEKDTATFDALRNELPTFNGFGPTGVVNLDPETAARQHLRQALASPSVPAFTTPEAVGVMSEFKSLGTETLPLTNTKTVKFRQTYHKIPVYGSLITVELDENNECLAINSALGQPADVHPGAEIAPADALQRVAKLAGYDTDVPMATPRLHFYFDQGVGQWKLVYIIEDVLVKISATSSVSKPSPWLMDYIVDARTGEIVAELPRMPSMAAELEAEVEDGLGRLRRIRFASNNGEGHILRDDQLNVLTFDFEFQDPVIAAHLLPGRGVTSPPLPWSSAAISAHANAATVAVFLREVLGRNNIDNQGGALISSVNCVHGAKNPGEREWFNAFWNSRQMVYGQRLDGSTLRSLAVNLDVVGHEIFHGVTQHTARLEYVGETGALNESYSDIFAVIISNFDRPDIADWDWELGEGLNGAGAPFRDLSDPGRFNQPAHLNEFRNLPNTNAGDWGGVHINSGIHNHAAFNIITARDGQGRFIFTPRELSAIFYVALTQHLTRNSLFRHSRRGVLMAARTRFLNDPGRETKVAAIASAFSAVGIEDPIG